MICALRLNFHHNDLCIAMDVAPQPMEGKNPTWLFWVQEVLSLWFLSRFDYPLYFQFSYSNLGSIPCFGWNQARYVGPYTPKSGCPMHYGCTILNGYWHHHVNNLWKHSIPSYEGASFLGSLWLFWPHRSSYEGVGHCIHVGWWKDKCLNPWIWC